MENINFNNAKEVVQYMSNICGLYEPLKQAFQSILENTQYVDITELKGNIEKLTEENEGLREKTKSLSKLEKENAEQKELIGSLGKQLVAEKLTRLNNEEALGALGKQLVELKLTSMKGGN